MNRCAAIKLVFVLTTVIGLIAIMTIACRYQGSPLLPEKSYNPVPRDSSVIQDRLENGFQFMLRPLSDCQTIFFALAVKTGAAAEKESEHGVAHFVEHMAFNGTDRFPGNQIISLLQTSGVEFGADLNAFTSYNYTCYYFKIPSDDPALLAKALEILEQWASAVSFEPTEVEKEKGVVLEEIRRKDLSRRRLEDLYRIGTRFEHHPIAGTTEDIHGISRAKLADFYKRWYQPARMVLAIVGGIDEVQLIKQIRKTFGHLRNTGTPIFEPWRQIPVANKKVLQVIDNRDGKSHLTLTWVHQHHPISDLNDLKKKMVQDFVTTLTQRHLAQSIDIDNDDISDLEVDLEQLNPNTMLNRIEMALGDIAPWESSSAVWPEIIQLRHNGFCEKEIELTRQAKKFDLDSQRRFINLKSEAIRLVQSGLYTLPLVDPDVYALIYERFLPEIDASTVQKTFNEMFAAEPNFIILGTPADYDEKQSAEEIASVILNQGLPQARNTGLPQSEPDLPSPRFKPGRIVDEEHLDLLDIIQADRWLLSNGMTVYLNEIADKNLVSFYLVAPGGRNALSADELPAARFLPMFRRFGAIEHLPMKNYENSLRNRSIDFHIFVSENLHGFKGSFPKRECEYVLGLIHQLMTKAKVDTELFKKVRSQYISTRKHQEAAPNRRMTIEILRQRYTDNQRKWPPAIDRFSQVTPEEVLSVFHKLFTNAKGFHFIYVGDRQHIDLKRLVASRLASLPHQMNAHQHVSRPVEICAENKTLRWDDNPENRSDVRLVYLVKGHDQSFVDQLDRDVLLNIIESRLDRIVREEYSMVYSFDIDNTPSRYPADVWSITIRFTCAPGNTERVVRLIKKELIALGTEGPNESELRGAVQHLRNGNSYLEKDIGFIVTLLKDQYVHKIADVDGLRYQELVNGITKSKITRMAHTCFNEQSRIIQAELEPPGKTP